LRFGPSQPGHCTSAPNKGGQVIVTNKIVVAKNIRRNMAQVPF